MLIKLSWSSLSPERFTNSTIDTLVKVFFLEEPLNCAWMDVIDNCFCKSCLKAPFPDQSFFFFFPDWQVIFSEYINVLSEISLVFLTILLFQMYLLISQLCVNVIIEIPSCNAISPWCKSLEENYRCPVTSQTTQTSFSST